MKYTPNAWGNGFTADVQVTNTESSAVNGWTLTYNLPAGQQVTSAWNATVSQSGSTVTARNISWNGSLAPGGTASFGLSGHAERGVLVPDQLHAQRGHLLARLKTYGHGAGAQPSGYAPAPNTPHGAPCSAPIRTSPRSGRASVPLNPTLAPASHTSSQGRGRLAAPL
ncbi:cellulose-binding domain-containing protein [Micromonospora sp. NPDC023633]|uniref:cellulose-binding domain-containing protein n=1 Tax=Micromonospora sp. NPDC023633 TaxID=3154320 RepID=UPI0033DDA517